jgi:hypothetical protein
MSFTPSPKLKRIVNKELIEQILDEQGCCLIGFDGRYGKCFGNDRLPHHIKTRGSGGDDERGNIIRVCLRHHNMIHAANIPRSVIYEILAKYT